MALFLFVCLSVCVIAGFFKVAGWLWENKSAIALLALGCFVGFLCIRYAAGVIPLHFH